MSLVRFQEQTAARAASLHPPVAVSFEFFPPNDEKMATTLWASIERLAPLAPRFVSVTYGADGSTRERTHNVVMRVLRETALTPAPHLTCIGASRGEILDVARAYYDAGVRHMVALRGDPPQGAGRYEPRSDGFAYPRYWWTPSLQCIGMHCSCWTNSEE